jgi:PPM family protein phosphatase
MRRWRLCEPEFLSMIRSAVSTSVGRVHDLNEDSLGEDPERGLWLVADGMGGHAAGEVASRVARDTLLAEVAAGQPLKEATLAAHAAVVREASANQAQQGMGTTSVALKITRGVCEMVWVGDSRGYLLRAGGLRQLTKDHSFMQMLIDRQHLTEEQARTHPKRNVVTQVLGYGDPVPDSVSCPLQTGDTLLLCSDGLYDELTDTEIAAIMNTDGDLQACVDRLVDTACDKGGRDNISAILVRYEGPDAVPEPAKANFEKTTVVRGRPSTPGGVGESETLQRRAAGQGNSTWSTLAWVTGIGAVLILVVLALWVSGIMGDMK